MVPDSTLLPVSNPARDNREVLIHVQRDNYEPHEENYTLPSPDTKQIDIELKRLKGMLTVKSMPDASPFEIRLDDPSILRPGTTEETAELEVTGYREPYQVKVWNDTSFPSDRIHGGSSEQDYIRYIPEYQPATVVYGETSEVNAMLLPLYVVHETEKGKLEITDVDGDENIFSVAYNLMDHKERKRKYEVSLSLMQGEETLLTVDPESLDCSGEAPCIGKGLRHGANGFTWDFSDAMTMLPEEYNDDLPIHPVLTLKRKGLSCNWACVLIPAAAGVASAYIWPRTGKNDVDTFIPPPRP